MFFTRNPKSFEYCLTDSTKVMNKTVSVSHVSIHTRCDKSRQIHKKSSKRRGQGERGFSIHQDEAKDKGGH